jgi:hypothetical protein
MKQKDYRKSFFAMETFGKFTHQSSDKIYATHSLRNSCQQNNIIAVAAAVLQDCVCKN